MQVTPALKQTDPPENFVSSVGRYNTNFETVKGNIGQRGGTLDQVTRFEAKKGDWYHRWGVAALQAAADAPAALQEFQNTRGDLVNMFPDDSPGDGGGHLYTGYAAGGSGRSRAEESSAQANATSNAGGGGGGGSNATPPQTTTPTQNANPGGGGSNTPPAPQRITHRTLETTLVGNLFDGVAQNKKPAAEQAKWIPYGGSQAAQWWSHVSAEYANTFTGDVHAHIDVGFGYYVKSLIVDTNPGAPRATLAAKLPEVIKLHPSVFRDDELPRIAALMGDGKVTALVAHLRCETSPGQVKSTSPSIPVAGIIDGASLIAAVDQALRAFVQPSELEANLPPDPAPTNNATPPPAP